jgi:hypothetical protein
MNPLKGASDNTLDWILGFGYLAIAIVCMVLEWVILSIWGIGLKHVIAIMPRWAVHVSNSRNVAIATSSS